MYKRQVTEQVIKGNVAIIKHTDDGETKIETPEKGASFEIYLKSAGSYDAVSYTHLDVYKRQGRYTDAVDDVLCKVLEAKKKKLKIEYI